MEEEIKRLKEEIEVLKEENQKLKKEILNWKKYIKDKNDLMISTISYIGMLKYLLWY